MTEFEDRIYSFCEANGLLDFDGVIVGLSGGPDSLALTKILLTFAKGGAYGGKVYALHVNHNMRPGECDEDEAFVKDFCSTNNIPLKTVNYDVTRIAKETGRTEEETGRILRYRAFEEYKNEIGSGSSNIAVAVAHHSDDLAETFMMNLFRGSGLEGLTGIKARNGNIIRPLLCVTKAEILEYLGDTPYCVDRTNEELCHTRNIWRNKVLPAISEVSVKTPEAAIRDTSRLLAVDSDYISSEMYKAFDRCKVQAGKLIMLDAQALAMYHSAIRTRVIRHLFLYVSGSLKDFETVNLDIADGMLDPSSSDREEMPRGYICFRQNGLLGFARSEDMESVMDTIAKDQGFVTCGEGFEVRVTLDEIKRGFNTKLPNSETQISLRLIEKCEGMEYNDKSWFCPIDLMSGDITITNSLSTLSFAKAGGSGSKKVRRIFTDLKVPREIRDSIVGVIDDDGVCFIPGVGHAKGFVSARSKDRCPSEAPEAVEVRFDGRSK